MVHRANIIGVALLCFACGSEALTLGPVRGVAWVGKPLNIVVPVQLDMGEDAAALCFGAEVFHADTRQETSRVRVLVEAATQPQTANVRVLSSAIIDEPVVTVYLRAGCGQQTTRRYVLLADMPSELPAPSPVAFVAPVLAVLPADASRVTTAAKAMPDRVTAPVVRPKAASKGPDAKASKESPKRRPSSKQLKPERASGQPRLQLDPLELLSDRVANLDSFMTFVPTEDALHNMQTMQALEGDVKSLLALAAKNEASVVALRARLQKAESERFPQGLIYGLMALVLACLATIAFLWNRQRRAREDREDWWRGTTTAPVSVPPDPVPATEPLVAHKELNVPHKAPKVDLDDADLDVNLIDMSDSIFDDLMQSEAQAALSHKQPSPAETMPAPSLNSEAMVDVCQQAAFFVSLGQPDRAVRVLKTHLDESVEPNPLGYLDLLSLFHSLNLKAEFQQYRKNFNRLFSGRVPEFSYFKDEGQDLESYSDVVSQITAFWSTSKVLEVLEAYIFKDTRQATAPSYDLAAFRDLLLLHAIAQSVAAASPSASSGPPDVSGNANPFSSGLDLDLSDGGGACTPAADIPLTMPDVITRLMARTQTSAPTHHKSGQSADR